MRTVEEEVDALIAAGRTFWPNDQSKAFGMAKLGVAQSVQIGRRTPERGRELLDALAVREEMEQ